jgi:hypothetical protein
VSEPEKSGRKIGWKHVAIVSVVVILVSAAIYFLVFRRGGRTLTEEPVVPEHELDGPGSNVDSIAFWEAADPAEGLMFVTAKGEKLVEVWAYPYDSASERPPLEHDCIDNGANGVVIDQQRDTLYVSVRDSANVCAFRLPELAFERAINSDAPYHGEPNLGLLHLDSGETRLYVTDNEVIYIHNAETGVQIGRFFPDGEVETAAGDDHTQWLHVPDENGRGGVYVLDAEGNPAAGDYGKRAFDSDAEGILFYVCRMDGAEDEGEGFIVVSDQRKPLTDFEFFDRRSRRHLGAAQISGVGNTDGIASTQQSSPAYPAGVFAAIDDDGSTVIVGWDRLLAATGLSCP